MNKKEPDLEFTRTFGLGTEDIKFWKDADGYLEIETINVTGETFLIILDPGEVNNLKELIK